MITVLDCPSWEVSGERRFPNKKIQTALNIGHRRTFLDDRAQFGWEELKSLTLEQAKEVLKLRLFITCGGNHPQYSRANFNRLASGDTITIQGQEFSSLEALFKFKEIDLDQEFQRVVEVLNGSNQVQ